MSRKEFGFAGRWGEAEQQIGRELSHPRFSARTTLDGHRIHGLSVALSPCPSKHGCFDLFAVEGQSCA